MVFVSFDRCVSGHDRTCPGQDTGTQRALGEKRSTSPTPSRSLPDWLAVFGRPGAQVALGLRASAMDVVHAGILRFGKDESKLTALLDKFKLEAASDPALASKMQGLGYL